MSMHILDVETESVSKELARLVQRSLLSSLFLLTQFEALVSRDYGGSLKWARESEWPT